MHHQYGTLTSLRTLTSWKLFRNVQPSEYLPSGIYHTLNTLLLWAWRHWNLRLETDLVNTYKVINHLANINLEHLFDFHLSNTRGHAHKVRKQHRYHDFWKHFFTLRVTEAWNKLPASVVSCRDTASFKSSMLPVIHQHYTWYAYTCAYITVDCSSCSWHLYSTRNHKVPDSIPALVNSAYE